ncbi:hypothetical protein V2J09_023790 [Rumex salicifolius]
MHINGFPNTKQLTYVHRDGGSSPSWNHTMSLTFDERRLHYRTFGWDKVVGEVVVSVKDLLAAAAAAGNEEPSGKYKGELTFSCKASDTAAPPPPPPVTVSQQPPPPQYYNNNACQYAHEKHGSGGGGDDVGMAFPGGLLGGILIDEITD